MRTTVKLLLVAVTLLVVAVLGWNRLAQPGHLVGKLLEHGVQFDVIPERSGPWASWLYSWVPMLAFAWAFPLATLTLAVIMLRHIRRIDDKLDTLLHRGDGPAGS